MSKITSDESYQRFVSQIEACFARQQFSKLLLTKYCGEEAELQRLVIRPVIIKNNNALSFVYSYKTKDITKNHAIDEGLNIVLERLSTCFKHAHLHSEQEQWQLSISKKGKVSVHHSNLKGDEVKANQSSHDRSKKRYVDVKRPFLTALGVTDKRCEVIPSMSRKWKQINKFVEIFSQAVESSSLQSDQAIDVVDFGSGKGYLTFAVHDYLCNTMKTTSRVTGVELRESLAALCNRAVDELRHDGLQFVCGDVKTHAPDSTDVMIALHACDTATDYAINYGIRANANIIMCSPCCHKQIRPQITIPTLFKPMLKYGVHLGQEAEMVTDSLRALLLEVNGYTTKVFEFVSLEHTNKNKMILAIKKKTTGNQSALLEQIAAIKTFYGIEEHCLETLLEGWSATAP